jgi:hypothetical protein
MKLMTIGIFHLILLWLLGKKRIARYVGHVSNKICSRRKKQALLTSTELKDNIAVNSSRDGKYGVKTVVWCWVFVDMTKNLWT